MLGRSLMIPIVAAAVGLPLGRWLAPSLSSSPADTPSVVSTDQSPPTESPDATDVQGEAEEDPGKGQKAITAVLKDLIASDPDAAEKEILRLPLSKERYELYRSLAEERIRRNPASAFAWAKALTDPDVRQFAIARSFASLGLTSPEAKLAKIRELGWELALPNPSAVSVIYFENGGGGGFGQDHGLGEEVETSLKALAAEDPAKALRTIASFPPEHEPRSMFHPQEDFLSIVAEAWVKHDDSSSFLEMLSQIPKGDARHAMFQAALSNGDAKAHARIAAEASQLTSDVLEKDRLIPHLTHRWLQTDPLAASAWVGQLEASSGKDTAIHHIVTSLTQAATPDFEAAFAWVQARGNGKGRERATKRLLQQWNKVAPDQAGAAIINADLPRDWIPEVSP